MIYQGKARYPVETAVLHCAAVPAGYFIDKTPFQVFATVNRWHRERGFRNGFGYHGLFMPDGTFFPGRPFDMIGAHVIEANQGTLGFLLIESRKIDRIGEFADWFTPAREWHLGRCKRFVGRSALHCSADLSCADGRRADRPAAKPRPR